MYIVLTAGTNPQPVSWIWHLKKAFPVLHGTYHSVLLPLIFPANLIRKSSKLVKLLLLPIIPANSVSQFGGRKQLPRATFCWGWLRKIRGSSVDGKCRAGGERLFCYAAIHGLDLLV